MSQSIHTWIYLSECTYANVKQVLDTVLSEFQNKVIYTLGIKQSYMYMCVEIYTYMNIIQMLL
jgi:hypothetical protein